MSNAATRIIVGRRSKWAVLVFWLLLVVALGSLAGKLTGAEQNDAKSWLPGNAESTKVIDEQKAFQSPNRFPAVIVYERPTGLTADDKAKISTDTEKYAGVGSLDGHVVGPVFSADGASAQVMVPLDLGHNGWNKAPTLTKKIRAIGGGDPGLALHVTGPAGLASDSADAFKGIDGTLLFAALGVVILTLLVTYRSPILWLLPVFSAAVALLAAQGFVYLLAKNGLTVNAQSAGILTVLVFGAGTDYALLLVARYREELRRHEDRHEAMALALHRSGPAIVASASTVALGMLCLYFAEMNSTKGLGPVLAIGVGFALAAMLSLLPALLVICGRWVFWPKRPSYGSAEPTATGMWARTGGRIAKRPRIVWVGTAAALVVMAIGTVDLDASGLTNEASFRGHPDSVIGETVLAKHFPAGSGSPVVVIANASQASQVRHVFETAAGIASVSDPVQRNGKAFLEGTMTAAPDSDAAYKTVDRLRATFHALQGADAKVGGFSATNLDVIRATKHDRKLIIPVVLIVVFVVLALLLRSLVAPVVLIATVVLSFAAALGISAVLFTHVFGFHGADTAFPLFVFVFLVALGIDYNIFLMTRVREEALKAGTRQGALTGLAATGGVITSAGVVLAGTFAVLATLPLTAFTEMGFTIALGVLLDTLVVRSVLVTALNLDIGDRMWWPSPLARRSGAGVPPQSIDLTGDEPAHVT
ncbi:MAG: putative drug exporter of the superfamily [Frankiaceae bacterium]|nr:putative drug exporter of the superfamily [Frankiaceae bacterium]